MNNLQIFKNEKFGEIQILKEKEKYEFEATGIAKILGYANPHDAIQRHCKKDGVVKHEVIDNLGRKQEKMQKNLKVGYLMKCYQVLERQEDI